MIVTITEQHLNSERAGHAPANSADYYAGTIDGKSFSVHVHPTEPPHWVTELTRDEKDEILAAIDDFYN